MELGNQGINAMKNIAKLAAVAAVALTSAPAIAAPVGVTGAPPTATARIIRPLTLSATGSVNLGTIVLNGVTADRTVSLSAGNVLDCGGGTAELACSGTTSVASYNVQGTNNQIVQIIKTASNLTNANDGSTLSFTPVGQNTVTLTNSGAPGNDFDIGGSIVIGTGTTDGVYSGTVDVKVDYQ
jgi:hypothetical protein